MLDPILSLASSVHSNKGVYALLLGSGISRSAGIPTGWEIIIDLVERIAAMSQEDCKPDPEKWYVQKYSEEPNYSKLLDMLAKTPAERNQLIRPFIEPTEEEREEGKKAPTKAHKAIAELCRKGYIKVIITTNFDRLMETALVEAGVTPTVISNPDGVDGAMPITHSQCT